MFQALYLNFASECGNALIVLGSLVSTDNRVGFQFFEPSADVGLLQETVTNPLRRRAGP